MRKAYDTILSDYVDADTAAKGGGFEPYRYECACCWEEVHLCAADSQNQATHFRHRSGNNNIECENYFGNRSAIISKALSRRNARDKIEFYFSSTTKMFSIGVRFNADEIAAYEQSTECFQVRDAYDARPTISIPIRSSRFLPDVSEQIPIDKFSWEYYISCTDDSKQRKYELFHKDGHGNLYPSFFKIQANGNDDNFQGKLVRTETLYTNTPYLIVFTHQHIETLSFQKGIQVDSVIKFKTMNRDFAGIVVTFTDKTTRLEQQLSAWKYTLETNEILTLLWPPSSQADDTMLVKAKYAYIFSSFEMKAHGNINVHSEDITMIAEGLTMVAIKPRIKVYKKNAELMLEAHEQESNDKVTELPVAHKIESEVHVTDDAFFMFNRSGVLPLSKGSIVKMPPDSEVRHYSSGYLDGIVSAPKLVMISGELLLQDALIHYKRSEPLNWDDFEFLDLSQCAFQYIEDCEKAGLINSAAKLLIKEGRI